MKSTLLAGLAVFVALGVAPALAGTEEVRPGLEKPDTPPSGLPGNSRNERGVIKDEATEVPNTGGVIAGDDETDADARMDKERSMDADRQETTQPDRSDRNGGRNGEPPAAPERE